MTMTALVEPALASPARRMMVESQLRPSGVTQAWVLAAMSQTPREDHLPAAARDFAYMDRAIPLANGRAMPAPLVQARLLGEAAPLAADRALLVSCGAGYLAALLAPQVGTLDVIDPGAPPPGDNYTLLVIEGAVAEVPDALAARLAEGARITTGLIERGVTRLASGRKLGGTVTLLTLAEIGIPLIPEYAPARSWSF